MRAGESILALLWSLEFVVKLLMATNGLDSKKGGREGGREGGRVMNDQQRWARCL